ncbi:MAG TPA: alkaline phosphatase family protein [Methylomirabilota bacterium]|nr:alkaline phosphatase family protein [Methylomirabilota bacterium]
MSARVLVLGVDAGSRDLIETWAAEGVLPSVRALVARGVVGDTESVEGFFVGSTWPSFYTGASPAEHGIHSLVQLRPGTYELDRCYTGDFVKREPFWNHLSRAGRRVAILDVPLTGVCRGLNGIQTVEWGSHDANYGFQTWPPGLAREVRARFGSHPLSESCDQDHRSPAEFVDLTRRLVAGVRAKAALTRHYLARGDWDLFVQVFTEGHCAGHQGWHLHDRSAPGWDAATVATTGDPLRDVYVAIDAAIGDILTDVGRDTLVVLLASHGMSYRLGAQFLLQDVLVRLAAAGPPPPPAPGGALPAALARGWARTPETVRRPVRGARARLQRWRDARAWPRPLPPAAREGRCFLVDNGLVVGGIRLNLAGREPQGRLTPAAAPEFCQALAHDLLEVVDAESGRPAVARVLRTDELYRGAYRHHLPDLLVEWSDARPLGSASVGAGQGATVRLTSRRIGTLEGTNGYCRSGDHRRSGLFVAVGPALEPGRMPGPVSIMDFAPTVARLLGVETPGGAGRPIPRLLGRV